MTKEDYDTSNSPSSATSGNSSYYYRFDYNLGQGKKSYLYYYNKLKDFLTYNDWWQTKNKEKLKNDLNHRHRSLTNPLRWRKDTSWSGDDMQKKYKNWENYINLIKETYDMLGTMDKISLKLINQNNGPHSHHK